MTASSIVEVFGLEPIEIPRGKDEPTPIPDGLSERQRAALAGLRQPIPSTWLDINNLPPRREQLLETRDGSGFLPRGIVGLLVAGGGLGKTQLEIALALSVAAGRPWLDCFYPTRPGRVVVLAGEEDGLELQRRFAAAAVQLGINRAEAEAVGARIHAIGLASVDVALIASPSKYDPPSSTTWALALEESLRAAGPWDLLCIDPVSRWSGMIEENNNSTATRFAQLLERLAALPGNPAVICAVHSSKTDRAPGALPGMPRGASALFDAARWVFSLAEDREGAVTASHTKSNYTARHLPIRLRRCEGGALAYDGLAEGRQPASVRNEDRVLEWLDDHPGWHSKTAISEGLTPRASRRVVSACLDSLVHRGQITRGTTGRYSSAPECTDGEAGR